MPPDFIGAHRVASSGPLVVLDETGSSATGHRSRIFLVDLEAESGRILATASDGWTAWSPKISGHLAVWLEFRYLGVDSAGSVAWRIVEVDVDGGASLVIDKGTNRRLDSENGQGAGQASVPLVAIDKDLVAYTIEDPSPANPSRWKIVLRSITSGEVTRTIPTAESTYGIALSDGNVAYTEGHSDVAGGFIDQTRLMVSTSASPTPRKVADDSFEVALSGDRLAWVSDPASSQGHAGLAQHPRIHTASRDNLAPVAASAVPDGITERGAFWPAAGDGLVSWADDQDTGPSHQPVPTGDHLVVFDPRKGTSTQLEPTAGMIVSGLGGGWLTWYNDWNSPTIIVAGIPTASLPLP